MLFCTIIPEFQDPDLDVHLEQLFLIVHYKMFQYSIEWLPDQLTDPLAFQNDKAIYIYSLIKNQNKKIRVNALLFALRCI